MADQVNSGLPASSPEPSKDLPMGEVCSTGGCTRHRPLWQFSLAIIGTMLMIHAALAYSPELANFVPEAVIGSSSPSSHCQQAAMAGGPECPLQRAMRNSCSAHPAGMKATPACGSECCKEHESATASEDSESTTLTNADFACCELPPAVINGGIVAAADEAAEEPLDAILTPDTAESSTSPAAESEPAAAKPADAAPAAEAGVDAQASAAK